MNVQLKNTSRDTIIGPVKVRVLTLESELGVPQITNADDGQNGTGAVWDFTSQLLGGTLASMKQSLPKTLTFRVPDLRPLAPGRDFRGGILSLDARVYGKLHKEKADSGKDKDTNENDGDK